MKDEVGAIKFVDGKVAFEGLRLALGAAELKAHFEAREAFHRQRHEAYIQKAREAADLDRTGAPRVVREEDEEEDGPFASQRPARWFRQRVRREKAAAEFFGLLERHLVVGATYYLSVKELGRYEFIETGDLD